MVSKKKNSSSSTIPPKETLQRLYIAEKKSCSEIADVLGVHKDTVRVWLRKCKIPRRTTSQAAVLSNRKLNGYKSSNGTLSIEETLEALSDTVEPVKYTYEQKDNLYIPLPIRTLGYKGKEKKPVSLILSISDLHLGHEAHLPDTYWSTIENLEKVLNILNSKFSIEHFDIVWNGDLVSGTNVYRLQQFQNLVQRGHWQVFLAEIVLRKTIDRLSKISKVNTNYLIKGTHEAQEQNYMLYLRTALDNRNAIYSSKSVVLDIGKYAGGHCNIFFTHGHGRSGYYPVSYDVIREIWKVIAEYRANDVILERISIGHSHWLTPEMDYGFKVSINGGFQKWEYTVSQRPGGCVLFMYCDGECTAIPVRPNEKVEFEEKGYSKLEYKNMKYYAEMLEEHLNVYEAHSAN